MSNVIDLDEARQRRAPREIIKLDLSRLGVSFRFHPGGSLSVVLSDYDAEIEIDVGADDAMHIERATSAARRCARTSPLPSSPHRIIMKLSLIGALVAACVLASCRTSPIDTAVNAANVVIALADVAEPKIDAWEAAEEQRCLGLQVGADARRCVDEARVVTKAYEAYWMARAGFDAAVRIARVQEAGGVALDEDRLSQALQRVLDAGQALQTAKSARTVSQPPRAQLPLADGGTPTTDGGLR